MLSRLVQTGTKARMLLTGQRYSQAHSLSQQRIEKVWNMFSNEWTGIGDCRHGFSKILMQTNQADHERSTGKACCLSIPEVTVIPDEECDLVSSQSSGSIHARLAKGG